MITQFTKAEMSLMIAAIETRERHLQWYYKRTTDKDAKNNTRKEIEELSDLHKKIKRKLSQNLNITPTQR